MKKTGEAAVQAAILDWLAVRHILAFRMNTGAMSAEHNGKKRFMRFGTPGMADVLAFPHVEQAGRWTAIPCWIECKAEKGKQSPLQNSFQKQVEDDGHWYIVARSTEDVQALLG